MQRIRTIKPEFFKHYELFKAEQETRLPLRLAFEGLWTVCDREGRFKWKPEALKLDCLPYDDVDFSRVLDALATRGYIVKYASGGREYGYIPTFVEHQIINNRESKSVLPNPTDGDIIEVFDASPTRDPRVTHASVGEGKGREGIIEPKGSVLTFFTDVKNINTPSNNLEKQISTVPTTEPELITTTVVKLVQPEKKPSKKKERSPEEKAMFTKVRQEFEKFYEEKYGSKYYFDGGKDAQAVYALIKKLNFKLKEISGENFDEAETLKAFNDFCAAAHRSDGFIHDHFSLSILNQQFNSIFSQVKSIQNGTAASKRTVRMSEQDAIEYVCQKRAWMRRNGQQP